MGKKKIGNKKFPSSLKGFSIQFLPYSEIKELDSTQRIKKILGIVLGILAVASAVIFGGQFVLARGGRPAPQSSQITVVVPNGGEQFLQGTGGPIQWNGTPICFQWACHPAPRGASSCS